MAVGEIKPDLYYKLHKKLKKTPKIWTFEVVTFFQKNLTNLGFFEPIFQP